MTTTRLYTTAPESQGLDLDGTKTLSPGIVQGPAGTYREVELPEDNLDTQYQAYERAGFDVMDEETFNYLY